MVVQTTHLEARKAVEGNLLAPTVEFLRRHAPFDRMASPHLEFLAKYLRLGFYPKDEVVTETARGMARTLYIIKQGRVRGELESGRTPTEGEVWELEAGEAFPIGAMLARRPVMLKHRAVEDTFCFELDREGFDKLLSLSTVFYDFCTRRLANLLTEALRGMQVDLATQSNDACFNAPLGHLVRRAPVTCTAETSIGEAVGRMHAERVGSIVIVDAAGAPAGIFTLHDLLGRVATQNLALEKPIATVMTRSPMAVSPHAPTYEAMILMTRHHIGHLCLVEDGRLRGVLSERDVFSLQRVGHDAVPDAQVGAELFPILLARGIATLAELRALAQTQDRFSTRGDITGA